MNGGRLIQQPRRPNQHTRRIFKRAGKVHDTRPRGECLFPVASSHLLRTSEKCKVHMRERSVVNALNESRFVAGCLQLPGL